MTVIARIGLPLLLLLTSALPASADPNDGAISGHIVNKSADGAPPAGIDVRLVTFGRKEQTPLGQRTTQSDASGNYAFSELDRDPNLVYVPYARYADVNYRPDTLARLQDQAVWQLDIAVYESTGDDRAIQFDRLNLLLLGVDQGTLHFMEMGGLLNTGDHTLITTNSQNLTKAPVIRLPLPRGALGINMESGFTSQDVTPDVGGVQITSPVEPGLHEFALSFQLPYAGSSADVTLQLPYPTQSYSFFVPQTGARLDSTVLHAGGSMLLGDQSYVVYGGTQLPSGAIMASQLSGLGGSALLDANQITMLGLAVVLFVLGAGMVVFTRFSRRRRTTARPERAHGVQERLDLVLRIAELDERFAAGGVSHAEYEAERRLAKQRLYELTARGNVSQRGQVPGGQSV